MSLRDPASYADLIGLYAPFDRTASPGPVDGRPLGAVAAWLIEDAVGASPGAPVGDAELRRVITRLLTIRPPRPIPPEVQQQIDGLFAAEAAARPEVDIAVVATTARPVTARDTRLHLWRGDITTLAVDAIVNAANAELLGCFRPGHKCIDNAIHTAAGPRLREDCRRIIEGQGHREPTGTAKVTRGYYLPSRFVLHTDGPIVPDGCPTGEHERQLAGCYASCLDLAANIGIRSVAFCAISTGVFGYPKASAAVVAVRAVRAWIDRYPGRLDHVGFDVFSDADEAAYLGPEMFG